MAFCDYLTVTYSPNDSPVDEVKNDLLQSGAALTYSNDKKTVLAFDDGGSCHIESKRDLHSVSMSGVFLKHLRSIKRYESMLALLSSSGHKVTRLDAAHDVPIDSPEILAALIAASPDGTINLTRKAVPMLEIMSIREDGKRSGTIYCGYKTKARVTAKVYDKALQMLNEHKTVIPPTTRYEITIKDGQATLNDAYDPTSLFWHFAAPVLLPVPDPAPKKWESGGQLIGWKYEKPELLPMNRLEKYIDTIIPTLAPLCDAVGEHGADTALYLLAKKLGVELPNSGH